MVKWRVNAIFTFPSANNAFAISGVLTALNKKLDPFGVFIIAFVTAVGGGTLRDVLIGRTPVGWMQDLTYVYMISLGFLFALIFRKKLDRLRTSLFLFDTIGLGVFTLIGLEKGIEEYQKTQLDHIPLSYPVRLHFHIIECICHMRVAVVTTDIVHSCTIFGVCFDYGLIPLCCSACVANNIA